MDCEYICICMVPIVFSVEINKKLGSYINELMYICSYVHVYIISIACKEMLLYIFMR
jgi:hypothetical protein